MRGIGRYLVFGVEFFRFKRLSASLRPELPVRGADRFPCLNDRTAETVFDAHYIYHTGWAARKIQESGVTQHVDISSSLYFVSLVSAFIPIRFFDYRPAQLGLEGVTCEAGDLLDLPLESGSVRSLSCMHVVEHVGLGRYGDPIDPLGDRKAANELSRVLGKEGRLLFVVPVGKPRVCFNAHRVYKAEDVLALFPECILKSFSLVTDSGTFVDPAPLDAIRSQTYGCGCFEFVKR